MKLKFDLSTVAHVAQATHVWSHGKVTQTQRNNYDIDGEQITETFSNFSFSQKVFFSLCSFWLRKSIQTYRRSEINKSYLQLPEYSYT